MAVASSGTMRNYWTYNSVIQIKNREIDVGIDWLHPSCLYGKVSNKVLKAAAIVLVNILTRLQS